MCSIIIYIYVYMYRKYTYIIYPYVHLHCSCCIWLRSNNQIFLTAVIVVSPILRTCFSAPGAKSTAYQKAGPKVASAKSSQRNSAQLKQPTCLVVTKKTMGDWSGTIPDKRYLMTSQASCGNSGEKWEHCELWRDITSSSKVVWI